MIKNKKKKLPNQYILFVCRIIQLIINVYMVHKLCHSPDMLDQCRTQKIISGRGRVLIKNLHGLEFSVPVRMVTILVRPEIRIKISVRVRPKQNIKFWPGPFQVQVQSAAKFLKNLRQVVSKNSYLMHFYEINICQVMIFRLHTVYNKYEMLKTANETIEKSQVLSQVLE